MAVIQIPFEVPEEVARGLASGELERFGSVIRNSSRIVRHLKEVQLSPETAAKSAGKGFAALRNPVVLLTTAASAAIVGGGAYIYSQHQRVEKLVDALAGYFEAVGQGNLDVQTIETMSATAAGLPPLMVRREKLAVLIEQVGHITHELSEANSVTLSPPEARATHGDNITDLQTNLNAQLRIVKMAA